MPRYVYIFTINLHDYFLDRLIRTRVRGAGAIAGQGGLARNESAIKTKSEGSELKNSGYPGYSPEKFP